MIAKETWKFPQIVNVIPDIPRCTLGNLSIVYKTHLFYNKFMFSG